MKHEIKEERVCSHERITTLSDLLRNMVGYIKSGDTGGTGLSEIHTDRT